MAARPIVRYPDPRLREPAAEVTAFDAALASLANDLLDTLAAAEGLGITACHIGVGQRVVVLQLDGPGSARTYVNPRIVAVGTERGRHPEGSVSLPGVIAEVERPLAVAVDYRDLAGVAHREEATGLLAVCHQHEIDQLDGIFWLERLSRLKRERLLRRLRARR